MTPFTKQEMIRVAESIGMKLNNSFIDNFLQCTWIEDDYGNFLMIDIVQNTIMFEIINAQQNPIRIDILSTAKEIEGILEERKQAVE